jgi:hypothetical protein
VNDTRQISPTKLALTLGAGLLILVLLLSMLSPEETPIKLAQLQALIADDQVASIEVSMAGVLARLRASVLLDIGGQRHRTASVFVAAVSEAELATSRENWAAAELPVRNVSTPPNRALQETAWIGLVTLLLSFGVYHLVNQARKHRRDGSPRQHLDQARADFDAGRISSEEYERRAAAISIEM